jgi:hypothetical protein
VSGMERKIDFYYDKLSEKTQLYLVEVAKKLYHNFSGQITLDCHEGIIANCDGKLNIKKIS